MDKFTIDASKYADVTKNWADEYADLKWRWFGAEAMVQSLAAFRPQDTLTAEQYNAMVKKQD